jgi:membrane protease YdiL (CAAX protease family)
MEATPVVAPPPTVRPRIPLSLGVGAASFVIVGLLLMGALDDVPYAIAVGVIGAAAVLIAVTSPSLRSALPWIGGRVDRGDLIALATLYAAVVGLFSLAFRGFTSDDTLGMFLSFGGGMLVGVAGPVLYTVWLRRRSLASLGITLRGWRGVVGPALLFAGVQFAITLWGYDLPRPVDWVPLLSMALTVGVFESVFFRGFVQGRLEASFGAVPAVAGAAVLYALYHVGYGMGLEEMTFLLGLGIVYAVAFRIANNVLVLWPLLTPLGSFFAQLESGDLAGALPWAAILGFVDVLGLMAAVLWFAHRHERKLDRPSDETPPAHWFEVRIEGPRR